jgi:hypothetical protein
MINQLLRSLHVVAFLLASALLLFGCTSQMRIVVVRSGAQQEFAPKLRGHDIKVLELDDSLPRDAIFIAKLEAKDTGVTIDCGYENVLAQTLAKARELGGDLIQIIQVYEPDIWSSCYRLEADVYVLPEPGKQD